MFDEHAFVSMPFKIEISYKVQKSPVASATGLFCISAAIVRFLGLPAS